MNKCNAMLVEVQDVHVLIRVRVSKQAVHFSMANSQASLWSLMIVISRLRRFVLSFRRDRDGYSVASVELCGGHKDRRGLWLYLKPYYSHSCGVMSVGLGKTDYTFGRIGCKY
jgi:hypothetical protein